MEGCGIGPGATTQPPTCCRLPSRWSWGTTSHSRAPWSMYASPSSLTSYPTPSLPMRVTTLVHACCRGLAPVCGVQTERLRFDFNLPRGMTGEEVRKVEQLVNSWIHQDHSLATHVVPLQEAKDKGQQPALLSNKHCCMARLYRLCLTPFTLNPPLQSLSIRPLNALPPISCCFDLKPHPPLSALPFVLPGVQGRMGCA